MKRSGIAIRLKPIVRSFLIVLLVDKILICDNSKFMRILDLCMAVSWCNEEGDILSTESKIGLITLCDELARVRGVAFFLRPVFCIRATEFLLWNECLFSESPLPFIIERVMAISTTVGKPLDEVEMSVQGLEQIGGQRRVLHLFLKEVKDRVHVTFAGMRCVKYRLSSHVHQLQLLKRNPKSAVSLAVLAGVPKRYVCEADHLFVDLVGPVEKVETVVRQE